MAFASESDLHAFVMRELQHVNSGDVVDRTHIVRIRCADPLLGTANENEEFAFVGGVANPYLDGWLERFIAARRDKGGGVLEAHLNCGYLHWKGYRTEEAQHGLIMAIRAEVTDMNSYYQTDFEVPDPVKLGSAEPFMDRGTIFEWAR